MKRFQRAALLVSLIESLRANGSWCSETSIQKSCYLLTELLHVPLGFEFILYKHGPYSFELTDELTGLRADSVLALQISGEKYGPRYIAGDLSEAVKRLYPTTILKYQPLIEFIAQRLGSKTVGELERVATAYYVLQRHATVSREKRARKLTELKPHVEFKDALAATDEMDEILEAAEELQQE